MNRALHLVYATDSRYLLPTQISAGSAIAWSSRPQDLVIHILDCSLADPEWQAFAAALRNFGGPAWQLVRHRIDMSAYAGLAEWHASKGIYARLEIPQILREAAWCAYADGDTLFTDDPFKLEALWDSRYALMGHLDEIQPHQAAWHSRQGLPWDPAHRICAGFILINLDWFRAHDVTAQCFRIIERYRPPYNDQDALNYVCRGHIGLLPDEWGKFTSLVEADTRRGCFHYVDARPWELSKPCLIPMNSPQRIWFMAMARIAGRRPWRCHRPFAVYVWQCFKTRLWLGFYLLANRLPFLRGRYNGIYKNFWPRRKELEFAPVAKTANC